MEEAHEEEEGLSQMKGQQVQQVIMDSRWKDLPSELHENILRFITIPELCRFRTVSHHWNNISKQLKFALQSRPQESTFIFRSVHVIETTATSKPRWQIYDPTTKKSFKLNMDFLNEGVRHRFSWQDDCVTLAVDKGFISVRWSLLNPESPDWSYIFQVANPITHSYVEIPPFSSPFEDLESRAVSLVVAEDYSAFALYVLDWDEHLEKKSMFRFDSKVGKWQKILQPARDGYFVPESIIKLGSTLFTIFSNFRTDRPDVLELLAFNTTCDTWSDTSLTLPDDIRDCQLVTTRGCLFLFSFGDELEDIVLMEIDVALSRCNLVTSLNTVHGFNGFFDKVFGVNERKDVIVVGCGDFIVISSIDGNSVAYDLVNSKWCEWIENNIINSPTNGNVILTTSNDDRDSELYYGMPITTMSLTLNPVPSTGVFIN